MVEAAVREQAARLSAAFAAGLVWTVRGQAGESDSWEPIVSGLHDDYVFRLDEHAGRSCVVVDFALDGGPPGLRWLHRFPPPPQDGLAELQEGVECGWIGRSLARVPAGTTPVWTDFSWGHPSGRWHDVMALVEQHRFSDARVLVPGDHAVDEVAGLLLDRLAVDTDRDALHRLWQLLRRRNREMQDDDRAATAAFMREHCPDGRWGSAWS